MAMFVALSPFALLTAMMSLASPATAFFAVAGLASALIAFDRHRGRGLKLLQAATAALTLSLGLCAFLLDGQFTSHAARLSLDAGLLIVMFASLALRAPFTIQYAREKVDAEIAARPDFLRANYVMTWVWTAAMVVMLAAEIALHFVPWLPLWSGLAAAFAARNGAAWFTQWYAARRRAAGEKSRSDANLSMRATGDVA